MGDRRVDVERGTRRLWTKIFERLRADIDRGVLAPGDALPSERELCAFYGVARNTARRALDELRRLRLVEARNGVGVFVCRERPRYKIQSGTRFAENFEASTRVLTQTISISPSKGVPEVADHLGLPSDGRIIIITRLRSLNGVPFLWNRSYLPAARFPNFTADYVNKESLGYVFRKTGILKYERIFTTIRSEHAHPEAANALKLDPTEHTLRVRYLNADGDGIPVEYGDGHWISASVEFVFP